MNDRLFITARLVLSLACVAAIGACRGKGKDETVEASAPTPSASASASTGSPKQASAKIGATPLADFQLENAGEMKTLLKPLGLSPIRGCGQTTFKGRNVLCTYGERPVKVSIERKATPKKKGEGYEVGPYTIANATLTTIDGAHVLVSAGFEGRREDADAVTKAIVDPAKKTIAGVKVASITKAKALSDALEPRGYPDGGYSSDVTVDFAFREVRIHYRTGASDPLPGTVYEEPPSTAISVELQSRDGARDPATEKKVLDTLLGR